MFVLCVILIATASVPDAHPDGGRIPGCGECAAYTLLRLLDCDARISDVSRTMRQRSGFDPNFASMLDVTNALESHGLRAISVRFSKSQIDDVPLPAIFYFRPGKWAPNRSRETGHFLTVASRVGDKFVAYEWTEGRLDPQIALPEHVLLSAWDGETIVSADSVSTNFASQSLLVASIAAGFMVVSLVRHRRRAALVLPMLLIAAGCGRQTAAVPSDVQPLLRIESPVFQAGFVEHGKEIRAPFKLTVIGDSPVTIVEISKSCRCTTESSDLIGRLLMPGSTHELTLKVQAGDGNRGTEVRTATLVTNPKSTNPLMVSVVYRRRDPPRLSVPEVVAEGLPGKAVDSTIEVTHSRAISAAPAWLRLADCNWGPFTLRNESRDTRIVEAGNGMKMAVDTTTLKLTCNMPPKHGEQRSSIRLTPSGFSPLTTPVVLRSSHPFNPLVRRIFVGTVSPGQSWKADVPFRFRADGPRVASCVADLPGLSMAVEGKRIHVEGVSPLYPGRFDGSLTVSFEPSTLEKFTIPIAGIVE